MKKILTGVIGCVFLFVIFSFLFPMSTVKSTVNLYWILNHRPFVTYLACERVLNRAASKDTVYSDVSRYMDEGTYNNLSVKTKSFYHDGQPWDDTVHVIHQQQDKDDPRLSYVDFIEYSTKKESIKWIRLRQLAVLAEGDSWKVIKYIEPIDSTWYAPTYFEHVYSAILPDVKK